MSAFPKSGHSANEKLSGCSRPEAAGRLTLLTVCILVVAIKLKFIVSKDINLRIVILLVVETIHRTLLAPLSDSITCFIRTTHIAFFEQSNFVAKVFFLRAWLP